VRREIMMAAAVTGCVFAAVACGGGSGGKASSGAASSGGGAYANPAATKPMPAAKGATVRVSTTQLGRILTDGNGRTLYLFEKDKGAGSSCSGACASIWPPLSAASGGAGVAAAKLGSIKRADGKSEATYAGHPLYTYAGDAKPGETGGEGLDQFGAKWYVLAPSGHKIDDD
jgi:predicted lipoprotein with Yx(FWY)xxD motif